VKRLLLTLTVVLVGSAGACTDDTARGDDPNQRLIDIYSAAIPAIVTYERPDLAALDELDTVVYVAAREGVDIALDVQIGVVVALDEWATIRFIDEFEEAIVGDESEQQVRDGGVLVQLGAVPEGVTTVELGADRYERADHLLSFELSLQRRGGEWSVVGPVEATSIALR
jgi:hypothetical protein